MYLSLFKNISIPPFSWCFAASGEDRYGYAVVSEYYGRGLFNKLTVVTESGGVESPVVASAPPVAPPAPAPQPYGPGAEAKLRQAEGQSKQLYASNTTKQMGPKGTTVVPVGEGRMRLLEQQRYSSSLEANLNKLEPVHKPSPYSSPISAKKRFEDKPRSTGVSPVVQNISTAIANRTSKNPFEEDNYDETKNPFAEEATEPTNPFNEDDDYDKNYNPFS
ncbi:uncharacterized protein LOC113508842 isoform X1 [Trichoplusia ni]|uniref:Uncharacterized protein LOC113507976 isoform X1 n=1 Tax=Trichoplusia ni TaxID=7111 RepID=A0A7E5X5M6_TRINI|nr:uncharacterized protein LOC113507976 isoform X1 [Trichoplusia ni]XP_026747792.1 uncharacterized protein LOC113508842 isoform X1 [Trichoplusia ni]